MLGTEKWRNQTRLSSRIRRTQRRMAIKEGGTQTQPLKIPYRVERDSSIIAFRSLVLWKWTQTFFIARFWDLTEFLKGLLLSCEGKNLPSFLFSFLIRNTPVGMLGIFFFSPNSKNSRNFSIWKMIFPRDWSIFNQLEWQREIHDYHMWKVSFLWRAAERSGNVVGREVISRGSTGHKDSKHTWEEDRDVKPATRSPWKINRIFISRSWTRW